MLAGTVLISCGGGHPSGGSTSTHAPSSPRASSFTTAANGPVVVRQAFRPAKPCGSRAPPGTYSPAQLAATQQSLMRATAGQFLGVGIAEGTVDLTLMAGDEALAARIARTYGSEVTIGVGLTSYCGGPGLSPVCPPMPNGNLLPTGLSLTLVLQHTSIRSGALGSGDLVVHEGGPGTFTMDTGQPITAELVRPGTRKVVGTYDAGIGGTGYGPNLTAGQSEQVPVVWGAARCDGGIGSAVPPGRYEVLAYAHHEERGPGPLYYAPGVSITVTSK